jgi:hypothetical protein
MAPHGGNLVGHAPAAAANAPPFVAPQPPLLPPYAVSVDVDNPSSYGRIGKGAPHKAVRKIKLEKERI